MPTEPLKVPPQAVEETERRDQCLNPSWVPNLIVPDVTDAGDCPCLACAGAHSGEGWLQLRAHGTAAGSRGHCLAAQGLTPRMLMRPGCGLMFVPSFSVRGNKNCYKTNSNLHCQLQPLFYNLNLGKKKQQQKTSLRPVDEQLKATHTHIQFFMFQRACLCPGHHLYKGNPYRTAGCRASIPQPHSPGILAHWQIKDRSQEDKESALFYTRGGKPCPFFFFSSKQYNQREEEC